MHEWCWNGAVWQCKRCLKTARRKTRAPKHCGALPRRIRQAVVDAEKNRHKIVAARDEDGLLCCWCTKCGCYMAAKAGGLAEGCRGWPTKQGVTVLNRVKALKHPEKALKRLVEWAP